MKLLKRLWSVFRGPLVRVSYWQNGADAARSGRSNRGAPTSNLFETVHEADLAQESWLNGWEFARERMLEEKL